MYAKGQHLLHAKHFNINIWQFKGSISNCLLEKYEKLFIFRNIDKLFI